MFRITGECQSLVMKALRSVMKSKAVGMCKEKESIPERNAKRKFLLNLMEQVLLVGGALKQNISIDFLSSRLQQQTQQFTQFQTLISDLTAAV